MNKIEIYNFLKSKNIWHEITEHKALYSMEDLVDIEFPYKDCDAKNLFVRDDKKINYYLITVKGNKRVNLKEFKNKNHTRNLSFAPENNLMEILNVKPGSVSPFGILNDEEIKVQFYLDKEFIKDSNIIGIHPNDNTATVWLKTEDLISIIQEHGNSINIVEI